MKKLIGLLLILGAVFTGCQKTTAPLTVTEVNAHVIDGGDPAADGAGFYIRVDSTKKEIYPLNLPAEYMQKDMNVAVAVKLVPAGKKTQLGMEFMYVVSIRKL